MEPNNIEKQFREKLNAREIQPSAQAWDRLDAMLSVAEEKKTKRPFGFLFIAASILVFVTLGLFLFNQNNLNIETPNAVVGTETKNETNRNTTNKIQSPIEEQKKEALVTVEQKSNNNKSIINQKTTEYQKNNVNQNQIIKDKTIEFKNSSDVALKDLPKVMEQKVIMVGRPASSKSDEILLANLDQTTIKSTNTKSTIKVNAQSLLSQVDGEVEQSFREKVFNRANKNYQEIKVALANRNNE
jgi:arsenate reductase-like glutaredoxin family protein